MTTTMMTTTRCEEDRRIPEIQRLQLPSCFLCDPQILIFRPLFAGMHPLSDLSAWLPLVLYPSLLGLSSAHDSPRGWLRNFHILCKHGSLWPDALLFLFTHPSISAVSFRITTFSVFQFCIQIAFCYSTLAIDYVKFCNYFKIYCEDNLYTFF